MKFYPAFLNLNKKKCLVIGAGSVARRKITSLYRVGARVVVLSPSLHPALSPLLQKGHIVHIASQYKKRYLTKAYFMVVAATDDRRVNDAVFKDATEKNILINSVDDPCLSNFIVPAVAQKGALTVAISTQGLAPALSRTLKEYIKKTALEEFAARLRILKKLRPRLRSAFGPKTRTKLMRKFSRMESTKLARDPLLKRLLKNKL